MSPVCVGVKALHALCIEKGRASLILTAINVGMFCVGCLFLDLEVVDLIPEEMVSAAAWVLALPLAIQWVCTLDDTVVRLVLQKRIVQMYLATVLAWAALACHCVRRHRVPAFITLATPAFALSALIDAVRSDAIYFKYGLLCMYIVGGASTLELWLLMITGNMVYGASDPFEVKLNVSSIARRTPSNITNSGYAAAFEVRVYLYVWVGTCRR